MRRFTKSSFAILNACGTGNPSATGFLERLGGLGFSAVIATATEVKAAMAVDFLHCFAVEQGKLRGPAPIGDVFSDTLACLREERPDAAALPYGDAVYAYMLFGDPAVPVCPL
jgi:hypothetical protein